MRIFLQANPAIDSDIILIALAGLVLYFAIIYVVVKIAVKLGNKDILEEIKVMNELKVIELKKAGVGDDQLGPLVKIVGRRK
jgi:hypothetical protein